MTVELHEFSGRGELAEALADAVLHRMRQALDDHDVVHMAVSGGTTPHCFFQALSKRPFAWDKVCITLVDERWVPDTDSRSNARMVRGQLLQNHASIAEFHDLYCGTKTPEQGVNETMRLVGGIAYSLDVAVLGMGLDGHTASLFPAGDRLTQALDPRSAMIFVPMNAPDLEDARLTMTVPGLLNADALFLHIEGPEKRAVLDEALKEGPIEDMPVRALINHPEKIVSVYWTA